jgi:hypothetical protein
VSQNPAPSRKKLYLGIAVLFCAVAGGAAWALWPKPEPPPASAEGEPNRDQTEEHMRLIGYVQ